MRFLFLIYKTYNFQEYYIIFIIHRIKAALLDSSGCKSSSTIIAIFSIMFVELIFSTLRNSSERNKSSINIITKKRRRQDS